MLSIKVRRVNDSNESLSPLYLEKTSEAIFLYNRKSFIHDKSIKLFLSSLSSPSSFPLSSPSSFPLSSQSSFPLSSPSSFPLSSPSSFPLSSQSSFPLSSPSSFLLSSPSSFPLSSPLSLGLGGLAGIITLPAKLSLISFNNFITPSS